MEKPEVEHMSSEDVERTEKHHAVEALPEAAKTEAGVLLSVDQGCSSSLHLAKDGHASLPLETIRSPC